MESGLLKKTQRCLIDGSIPNPISVKVESKNQGGFNTKIFMRSHVIESDQPNGFAGENKGPKPSELVLAALAACQETTWRIFADDMGIKINEISVRLTGSQDLRGFMSVDKNVPAGFESISGEVFIDSDASLEKLEALKSVVDDHCPVMDDLIRSVQINIDLKKA